MLFNRLVAERNEWIAGIKATPAQDRQSALRDLIQSQVLAVLSGMAKRRGAELSFVPQDAHQIFLADMKTASADIAKLTQLSKDVWEKQGTPLRYLAWKCAGGLAPMYRWAGEEISAGIEMSNADLETKIADGVYTGGQARFTAGKNIIELIPEHARLHSDEGILFKPVWDANGSLLAIRVYNQIHRNTLRVDTVSCQDILKQASTLLNEAPQAVAMGANVSAADQEPAEIIAKFNMLFGAYYINLSIMDVPCEPKGTLYFKFAMDPHVLGDVAKSMPGFFVTIATSGGGVSIHNLPEGKQTFGQGSWFNIDSTCKFTGDPYGDPGALAIVPARVGGKNLELEFVTQFILDGILA